MPRSLRGLVLAGALVLAGCGVGGQKADDSAEPKPITKAQLAAMVLPRDELGTVAEGLTFDKRSGPVANAAAAEGSIAPNDTATSLRSDGRLNGHKAWYGDASLASLKKGRGVFFVGTEVELMEDTVYAAQYLHTQLGDFQRFQGKEAGTTLSGVKPFPVNDVGDEAEGFVANASAGRDTAYVTTVAFRRNRIIGAAIVIRGDKEDAQGEARALAVKLDGRIQAVLAGEIPVDPAPEEDAPTDAPAAAAERLPQVTLQPQDVGASVTAVDEGELAEAGYVGYQRTFEDVVVGGSHLIRLQARTAAYERPAQAAVAHRLVTQAVGRRAFADGIARAFGKETAVTPTDIRVRSFATGVRGMTGVVATFELVGARFRTVSVFVRSGRFVQSVTGICRPDDVRPDDLTTLARRAQARLTV
jgi:hypothetical protein